MRGTGMAKHLFIIGILLGSYFLSDYYVEQNAYQPPTDTLVVSTLNEEIKYEDFYLAPLTYEEHCVNEYGEKTSCRTLHNIQDGDILISKSSHTLGVRHGHAALVVDASAKLILEAFGYGSVSKVHPLEKWETLPTVQILRLKEVTPDIQAALVETAKAYEGLPYHLLTGAHDMMTTHCSDIVFKVFRDHQINLNSDGGYWVTPKDISQSPHLEVVASYGFSETDGWSN